MNDQLLPIGRFARLAGLTVGALRHYDEEGVLPPADVDPLTGYRRYRADQVATARAVAALRDLELSLPAIRALLESDDPAGRATILATERRRLEARTARLQRALHRLSMLSATAASAASPAASAAGQSGSARDSVAPTPSTRPAAIDDASGSAGSVAPATSSSRPPSTEVPAVPTPTPPPTLDPETHRALGAGLFNRTWTLLEIEDRTATQDAELIDTAHASAWHWRQVGNAANEARGQWIIARVYSVLGHAAEAVYHARRANEVVAAGGDGIEDWDAAAAAEALARALAVSGDTAGAAEWKARAATILENVADPEERAVVEGDLATIPA